MDQDLKDLETFLAKERLKKETNTLLLRGILARLMLIRIDLDKLEQSARMASTLPFLNMVEKERRIKLYEVKEL